MHRSQMPGMDLERLKVDRQTAALKGKAGSMPFINLVAYRLTEDFEEFRNGSTLASPSLWIADKRVR